MKILGAVWKQFYSDENYWEGRYHDDTLIRFDRVIQDEYDNPEDDAVVEVESGYVYRSGEDFHTDRHDVTLIAFFKAWQKKQSTRIITVVVDKDYEASVKAEIKQLDGVKSIK